MGDNTTGVKILDISPQISVVVMKKHILNENVLMEALQIAKTGTRPLRNNRGDAVLDDDGIETWERVSAKDQIDVLKLLINKVLPNAKDVETTDDTHAKWLGVIEDTPAPPEPPTREQAADIARVNAIAVAKQRAYDDGFDAQERREEDFDHTDPIHGSGESIPVNPKRLRAERKEAKAAQALGEANSRSAQPTTAAKGGTGGSLGDGDRGEGP